MFFYYITINFNDYLNCNFCKFFEKKLLLITIIKSHNLKERLFLNAS